VGYLKGDFESDYSFHKNDSLALNDLRRQGVELIPVELPDVNVSAISFILSAEAAAAFDLLTRSNEDDKLVRQIRNAWPNVFRSSRFIPAVEYINANRIRYELIQQMNELMSDIDILIAPSWTGKNLLMTNLTGHPCVVVPNGFSAEGTPTSISFVGELFDEGTIISFAKYYQHATGHHLKHPDINSIIE
jgi:Asp-tRNA(Asn)/Glu-tRNA(Gln) amidotransferase A subunit family amidase